ncbi:MAG: elongation factor P [Treponema sp.]|jgi:elongation factor P|nr:elongation factor P [Treponema sp.]
MFTTSQLRVGTAFMYEGNALIVQKLLGQRSGRSGMVTNLRVKNLVTGQTMDLGLDAGEKFDEVDLDTHTTKLSYIDGEGDNALYVFMDQETYEQFELPKSDLGDNAGYITPEDDVEIEITFYEGKPVGIVLPVNVTRTITYCEPGVKGDTSGKSLKPATLDTGIEVRVPLFINSEERIVIDTRDGSFVERAKN